MTKVLITGKLHESALTILGEEEGLSVTYRPDCPRPELEELITDVSVLITRSETKVDRELMDKAPALKIIARAAVGVGNIDLNYATEKGILVVNTPGKNTNSAAELTLGLLLTTMRKTYAGQERLKAGGWDRHKFTGRELRGKTIGIVGLGNVGHRVAKFCLGFDMEVLAYDPYISPERFKKHGATQVKSLTELASKVDILSVHVPLNKETTNMITRDVLEQLHENAIVLNAARGGIIDEELLVEFLEKKRILGAGVDTFVNEPEPLRSLVDHDAVVCTPHIGASTLEAQQAIGETVAQQVIKAVQGSIVDYPVNFPEIGEIKEKKIKTYTVLAENLGSIVGQLIPFNPAQVDIYYRGSLAGLDNQIVKLGFMKGYGARVLNSHISFVNVLQHFDKLGIKVGEHQDTEFRGYKSALKVVVTGQKRETLTIGGVVFDDTYMRLTLLNDFHFEVVPEPNMIMVKNHDKPGVIANVSQTLASQGLNISSFNLSRNQQGGHAMAIIGVDSALSPETLGNLRDTNDVLDVKWVKL